jgi:glycosyltransferase involved in cell wall biosynthesis
MSSYHFVMLLFYPKPNSRQIQMLRSIRKRGWKISVIAWDRKGNSPNPADQGEFFDYWHYVRLKAPVGESRMLFLLPQYFCRLKKIFHGLNKPDVVCLTHFLLLPFSLFSGTSSIYDASEMYILDLPRYFGFFRLIIYRVMRFVEGSFVKRIDGVLTVDSKNNWYKQYYGQWNQNVRVIWNVPSLLDDPYPQEVKKLNSEYSGKKVIAFVGGLRKRKGLREAIEAAALVKEKHPNVLFLFVGSMRDDAAEIDRLVRVKNVKDNVRFLDWMPYKELLAHLNHAQIGLALHHRERIYPFVSAGNGRKFFSYMQAGLAIIGPDFGEVGKAVEIANCGVLVNTESSESIAQAILELFSDPEKLKKMKENGRKAFLRRFNWENEEKNYLLFLDRITNAIL